MSNADKKQDNDRQTILPEDTRTALNLMTTITRQMLELVLEEGKILKDNDLEVLASIQKGKNHLADGYQRAAVEFRERLEEFRALDSKEMEQLDALTAELGKAIKKNQIRIESLGPKKPLNQTNSLYMLQEEQTAQ